MNPPYSRDALNSRFAQRWSAHYKVQFACLDYAGEGMTLDVSAGGLCIITNREIAPGVEMYARLVLPDRRDGLLLGALVAQEVGERVDVDAAEALGLGRVHDGVGEGLAAVD